MADPKAPIASSEKSPETVAKQNDPKAPESRQAVQLDHGDAPKALDSDKEADEKVKADPWGDTPMQQRDTHSPEVDPENDDAGDGTRAVAVNPLEPGLTPESKDEPAPTGGTNAPA